MREKISWGLLGVSDFLTEVSFRRKPGLISKACLAIADWCDALAMVVHKGGAA